MREYTYTLDANAYKETELFEKQVTCQVPETVQEALSNAPGTDTPFFATEGDLVAAAVAQMNIKKNHAVTAEVKDRKEGEPLPTLDRLIEVFRSTVMGSRKERGTGTGTTAKAKRLDKIVEAVQSKLGKYNKTQLATLVDAGVISQEEMDAELANRTAAQ